MIKLYKYKDNGVYFLHWDFRKKTKKYGYKTIQNHSGFSYGKDAIELYKTTAKGLIDEINRYRFWGKRVMSGKAPKWWLRAYLRNISYHLFMMKWIEENANNLDAIAEIAIRQTEYNYN